MGVTLPLDFARGRVGLPAGSAVRLVAACPYRLRRGIRRQCAPAHPPVHLTRGRRNIFCKLVFLAPNRSLTPAAVTATPLHK